MLAEAHQQAAEDIEKTILPLQATAYAARVVIEGACPLRSVKQQVAHLTIAGLIKANTAGVFRLTILLRLLRQGVRRNLCGEQHHTSDDEMFPISGVVDEVTCLLLRASTSVAVM